MSYMREEQIAQPQPVEERRYSNESSILKQKRRRKGPAERMWAPIKLKLDENYEYVTKNLGLRFLYYFTIIVGMPFVYLYYKIRWKFKVVGRKNARLLKNTAAVTVANHVHNVDAFMLTSVFYPDTPYFVALKHNFEAFLLGGLVRVMRGVPLPEEMKNFERFSSQLNDLLKTTKHKLQIFPEGEIEPFGRQLRPFKNGAFHFSVKNNVPVLPMTFVFDNKNNITLLVGEPVFPEKLDELKGLSVPKKVVCLSKYVKGKMQQMMDEYYSNIN